MIIYIPLVSYPLTVWRGHPANLQYLTYTVTCTVRLGIVCFVELPHRMYGFTPRHEKYQQAKNELIVNMVAVDTRLLNLYARKCLP